jgi:hypothetical protein
MSVKDISQGFLAGDLAAALGGIDVVRLKLEPNRMNLTPGERKKTCKLGYASEPFAEMIMTMAAQHSNAVPSDIDIAKVQMVFDYRKDLLQLKNNKLDVDELVDDLIMNTGVLLMGWLNRIYSNARDMAKRSDYPFSEMVKEAGIRYQKSTKTTGTNFSITGDTEIIINHVIPGGNFVNNGSTVLVFGVGPDLAGKIRQSATYTVEPNTSVKVPKGFYTILVKNLSKETEGSFSVRIKS